MTGLSKSPQAQLKSKYDFRSEVLDVIISGRSMIDSSPGLNFKTPQEIHRFVKSYGYDLDNPIEVAELMGNFHEAMSFVKKMFLQPENPDGLKLEIPRKILELTDVSDLLKMASGYFPGQTQDGQGIYLKNWACSLLKVIHTIAHVDKDLRSPYFLEIQMQILDRYYKVIHRDTQDRLYIGDGEGHLRIDLVVFETKPKKSRESVVLKLLHKPENVAEELFDRVGIRIVTETPVEALQVVKFLRDRGIVIPPNIKPSRSRNTLVNVEALRSKLPELLRSAELGEISEEDLRKQLNELVSIKQSSGDNPHSSEFYRSIQFTARQLIKLRNPMVDHIKAIRTLARSNPAYAEIQTQVERIDMTLLQREVRFFYPYEIQVFDRAGHEESKRGKAAHSEYKKSQVLSAMRRVMGGLIDAAR